MSINSRDKGNRFERVVAKALTEWWGAEFCRTPLSGGWSSKAPGDIITPDDFPFGIEAKHRESWSWDAWLSGATKNLEDWMEQAAKGCKLGQAPMLLVTKNRAPIWVVVTEIGAGFLSKRGGYRDWTARPGGLFAMPMDSLLKLDRENLRVRGGVA